MNQREKIHIAVLRAGEPVSISQEHRDIYIDAAMHGREYAAQRAGLSTGRISQIIVNADKRYAIESFRKGFPYPREWEIDTCFELPVASRAIMKNCGLKTLGEIQSAVESGDLDLAKRKFLGRSIPMLTTIRANPIIQLLDEHFALETTH
ncbi:hypothetical protein [Erythrobacter aureus]|uniref:Uncharacterized protein n=1 Tax=Erythrobacter aureus TaxID=2182384 RepID=A0A345YJ93_9SPHN|nr:hypothetical protein [Erythrobacter aureus]AXK43995.1 hypothetical protein DVR09_16200 [Erythrobacter aureus]